MAATLLNLNVIITPLLDDFLGNQSKLKILFFCELNVRAAAHTNA